MLGAKSLDFRESLLLAEGLNLNVPALVAEGDTVGACCPCLHVLGVDSRCCIRVLLRHTNVAVALEEFDTLVASLRLEAARDEDGFVVDRETIFFEELLCPWPSECPVREFLLRTGRPDRLP